jgi:hypothetical protein
VHRPERVRRLLIAYALLNALFYSLLLPLWEGFDEPFHFGYVQQIANLQGWPDARTSTLSAEVEASLPRVPASPVVKINLRNVPTFEEYFSWPPERRAEMQRELRAIPPDLRRRPGPVWNYEALQAPLAYILMAPVERMLALVPLPSRVAILRFLLAALSSLALLAGAQRLFRHLRIPDPYAAAASFAMLSCQMLWATVAHVGNDWLAVALSVWLLVALIRYYETPGSGRAAMAAAILGAGLLTKAYFLAPVPILIGLCAWRRRWRDLAAACVVLFVTAGPWYARNLHRYGDLTATMETRSLGLRLALETALRMPWLAVAGSTLRSALWTGNNSLLAFSAGTLHLMIAALLAGWTLWLFSRRASAGWITLAYCGSFALVFAYSAIAAWLATSGAVKSPQPWYPQVIAAPAFGIAFAGASRRPRAGPFLAAAIVLLSGYVLAATYVVKLIPWYGGFAARTTLRSVASLYAHGAPLVAGNLDSVALAPAAVIFAGAAAIVVLIVVLEIALIPALARIPYIKPPNDP